jgi:Tfp pilus assembly protein PilF
LTDIFQGAGKSVKKSPQGNLTLPSVIVALSFGVALFGLVTDSFWGDEILTALFAGRSPAEVIRWTASDIHPPLYYLVSGTFTHAILTLDNSHAPDQVSDWLWRFPSVMAVVLTVAVTYRLSHTMLRLSRQTRVLPHYPALSTMLLLSVSPIVIKYAQEARMHALFMFLAALSTLLLARAILQPQRWNRWLIYTAAMTATIYTMYFGFLILTAHGLLVVAMALQKYWRISGISRYIVSLVAGFTVASLLTLVLYLPWWPVLVNILVKRAAVGAIEGGVGNPVTFLNGVVIALGPPPEPVAWLFFGLFAAGSLLLLFNASAWPVAVFGAAWVLLPAALPIVLGDPRALQFRYAFVLPIYLFMICAGVWHLVALIDRRVKSFPYTGYYMVWLLGTLSLIGTIAIYQQSKPNWRDAAAFLSEHTVASDIILIGPLWDEGRFIGYYYRGDATLLTPAAMVTNIEGRVTGLRQGNGRVWAVNRFSPAETGAFENHHFDGVVVSEPKLAVFDPEPLRLAIINLASQAVDAAYPWAAEAQQQGTLDPDPRTAQAGAYRALGDTFMAAGKPDEAVKAYQTAVDIFPGWINGYLALADTHYRLGNLSESAAAYQNAVNYNLQWQGPAADEAAALVVAQEWQAAIEKYRQIIGD